MSIHLEKCAVKQCGYVFLVESSSIPAGDNTVRGLVVCPHCGERVEADPAITYITRSLPGDIRDWPKEGAWA
jgi:hypothetical protein